MVATKPDGNQTVSASKSRLRLWIQLLRTTRYLESEVRNRLRREFDETLPRFDVMAALHRNRDGLMMSKLSRVLMVSNGNVTGIVDRLVKGGLAIRSQRDGDRRTWIICLTKTGTEHFEKMAGVHEAWINELLQNIEPDAVEVLNAHLSAALKDRPENHE
jgi:DNA-binding MarR family transcriptional regulator